MRPRDFLNWSTSAFSKAVPYCVMWQSAALDAAALQPVRRSGSIDKIPAYNIDLVAVLLLRNCKKKTLIVLYTCPTCTIAALFEWVIRVNSFCNSG